MCDFCDKISEGDMSEFKANADKAAYVREDYRDSQYPSYIRATYVDDFIVVTELNNAFADNITRIAAALGVWAVVPEPFITSAARIGNVSLGEYMDYNDLPELIGTEYSRKLSEDNPDLPNAEELDAWHESFVQRVKDGDIA